MKKEYSSPSMEEISFNTQKVLFDTSEVFHDKENEAGGDETVIKPFG